MFRRIELINEYIDDEGQREIFKHGLMGVSQIAVAEAWIDRLRGPGGRSLPANSRFWFTETGWREVGRHVAAACRRSHQGYQVLAVRERDVEVVWRDQATDYEVALQRKRRPPDRARARSRPDHQ
jgi:hypothetical protein